MDMNLQNSAVSQAVLAAGGQPIQDECNRKAPHGIKHCELLPTSAGRLRVNTVYHTSLPEWDGSLGQVQKKVRALLQQCMAEASNAGYRSLAFPMIGTGSQRYPHSDAVAMLYEEIVQYSLDNHDTSLKEVRIVVYDRDIHSKKALSLYASSIDQLTQMTAPTIGSPDEIELLYPFRAGRLAKSLVTEAGFTVTLVKGSIETMQCDAIVNTTSASLDLKVAKVSLAILNAGGQSLQDECHKNAPDGIKPGQLVRTSGGKMNVKAVYHTTMDKWDGSSGQAIKVTRHFIQECLSEASAAGFKSLAMPALGTGALKYPHDEVAKLMYDEFAKFSHKNPKSALNDVKVVLHDKDFLSIVAFENFVKDAVRVGDNQTRLGSLIPQIHPRARPPTSHAQKGQKGIEPNTWTTPNFHEMIIRIYAMTRENLKTAEEYCETVINEISHIHTFDKDTDKEITRQLDANQTEEIKAIADKYECEVNMMYLSQPCIRVNGGIQQANDCVTQITEILGRVRSQLVAEDTTFEQVKWEYVDENSTQYVTFSKRDNYVIERAYQRKESTHWTNKDGTWEVDLDNIRLTLTSDSKRHMFLQRRIEGADAVPLPGHWKSFGETDIFLYVELKASSQEYKEALKLFRASCKKSVMKIQRIQCRSQYQAYTVQKQNMTKSCPTGTVIERKLFHGTRSDALESIIINGFNRSYCGRNLTAYGNGVYFAVHAQYSADTQYSVPDRTGAQHMFLCSVLTGTYTDGRDKMKVPPPRDPHTPNIRHNSVVDDMFSTKLFVVFYDNQAYPEYLITFK